MRASAKTERGKLLNAPDNVFPLTNFYELQITLGNGEAFSFEKLRGKKIMLVNTASDCGYTAQFDELQKLYRHSKDELEIIGFPANDFNEQEKNDDAAIGQFCRKNFGVSFPIAKKTVVVPSREQHPVYRWLTNPELNGWNGQAPSWNFAKYLIDEEGKLTHYFGPSVSPLALTVRKAIHH
jgi:glutathione peroxidase